MLTITFNIHASWLNLIQGLVSYVVYIVLPQAEKPIFSKNLIVVGTGFEPILGETFATAHSDASFIQPFCRLSELSPILARFWGR